MNGGRIRQLRERAKLTQEELGSLVGVAMQQVSRWESGAAIPRADTLGEIARVLASSADYILGLTDDPAPCQETLTQDEREMLDLYRRRNK